MHWLILDTETSGIHPPIFALELAAQRMCGWEPDGPPFRRMLNHNQDIAPEASRVNGFTREILERDGDPPRQVYLDFADYAGDLPLVAYNLPFDLDQVLRPEWERLGIEAIGHVGFCALRLAQRLLDPVPAGNHKLQTLRQYYRLPERGAHTALGDVQTVIDLMQLVLRPLAAERGLHALEQIQTFATEIWYPARIAFGKFKGRHFGEAAHDTELNSWLQWLARSSNPRSAEMGRWYLQQLEQLGDTDLAAVLVEPAGTELVIYSHPELGALRRLIAEARSRLAELETEFTRERYAVDTVQARLFELLRPAYQQRDELRLVIRFRRKYLDVLMQQGEDEAAETAEQYQRARDEAKQEYEQAAEQSLRKSQELSEEEQAAMKNLWRKLVRLYHPDRYQNDPEKQAIYQYLTAEINQARDQGDLDRLRDIADDPNGFLLRQGMASLDFDDDDQVPRLCQLYDGLQAQIMEAIENLYALRASADYDLYLSSTRNPDWLQSTAQAHAEALQVEIVRLEEEAAELANEIEGLTGERIIG
jgi:DNA polymerase III epsilon subunit-like protein